MLISIVPFELVRLVMYDEETETVMSNEVKSAEGWYKGFRFDSEYEYLFMKQLEVEGFNLKDDIVQNPVAFSVPFSWMGEDASYTPDFYCPSMRTVYEVKDTCNSLDLEKTKAKIDHASKFFSERNLAYKVIKPEDLTFPKDMRSTFRKDPCVFLTDSKPLKDLKAIFEEQRKFMHLLRKERNGTEFPVDLKTKAGLKIVKDISHECMHELFEAIHLLSDAKAHKKTMTGDFDRAKFLEELSDVLHYFVGICILCDINENDIYNAFMRKGTINFSRILGDY